MSLAGITKLGSCGAPTSLNGVPFGARSTPKLDAAEEQALGEIGKSMGLTEIERAEQRAALLKAKGTS
jgi:hypothetical protein